MIKNVLLDEYYFAFDKEDYAQALGVLNAINVSSDELPWLNSKKAECYYELRDYKTAISFCRKALKKQINYPFALWTISNSYYYMNKYKISTNYFLKLEEMDEYSIGKVETRMGITWARSLKMDVCLKLADALYMTQDDKKSVFFYNKFIEYRKRRVKSSLPVWYIKDMKLKMREIMIL